MSGFYWLASYPKSGNTWVRSFLWCLLRGADKIDLNELFTGGIASSREWVEDGLGIDISLLTHSEIDRLRPLAYQTLARDLDTEKVPVNTFQRLRKVHDAYTIHQTQEPLFPTNATAGAIYLVRNPLDVVISWANHARVDLQTAVDQINNPEHSLASTTNRQVNQLRQILSTWSNHSMGWLNASVPKIVLRYEDLQDDPVAAFTAIVAFLGVSASEAQIVDALTASSFETLQLQEMEFGFREKPAGVKQFFRKALVGEWQSLLSKQQIESVVRVNCEAMARFGYLSNTGAPLVRPAPMLLN